MEKTMYTNLWEVYDSRYDSLAKYGEVRLSVYPQKAMYSVYVDTYTPWRNCRWYFTNEKAAQQFLADIKIK